MDAGAFRAISDGREGTHGPVSIVSFYLRDRPDRRSWSPSAALLLTTFFAAAMTWMGVVVFAWRFRSADAPQRHGYTAVANPVEIEVH
mmetsp:Transcript_118818/g.336131  ORF Transcript_118818/g.336131 Transcript_118818/m.336131 type:complete len:88 (+) Transcript_118818:1-264(+)